MAFSPRILTADDKFTVENLDTMISGLKDRLDPKITKTPVSEPLRKKIEKLITRYQSQKAKTVKLYHRHKKALEHKAASPYGLRVSQLSVFEIYKRLGKTMNTKSMEALSGWRTNELVQTFLKHPVENTMLLAGAGAAIGGFLGADFGTGTTVAQWMWENIVKETFTTLFGNGPAVAVLASGVGLVAAACVMKLTRKRMEQSALLKQEVEEQLYKGTERDETSLSTNFNARKDDLIQKAASGASATTNETYQYLLKVANSSDFSPNMRRNAMLILREADKHRANVEFEQKGFEVENTLEGLSRTLKDYEGMGGQNGVQAYVYFNTLSQIEKPNPAAVKDKDVRKALTATAKNIEKAFNTNAVDLTKSVDEILAANDGGLKGLVTPVDDVTKAQDLLKDYVEKMKSKDALKARDFLLKNGFIDLKKGVPSLMGEAAQENIDKILYETTYGSNPPFNNTDKVHLDKVKELRAKYAKYIQNAAQFNLEKEGMIK